MAVLEGFAFYDQPSSANKLRNEETRYSVMLIKFMEYNHTFAKVKLDVSIESICTRYLLLCKVNATLCH